MIFIPFRPRSGVVFLILCVVLHPLVCSAGWVRSAPVDLGFPLAWPGHVANIGYAPEDHPVVGLAVGDLAGDLQRVTGLRPDILTSGDLSGPLVLAGTLGRCPPLDALVRDRKIDLDGLDGAWESFVITTVSEPAPGGADLLVIAGSDPRGTAYGVYELSQAIGVSPWHWWADVPAAKADNLWVAPGTRRFGPPSVKYRGIFINDEDWGLHPWASRTFDPELGDIGPKTYERVFELLLRLKANTLWPAMHEVTRAFNLYPENAVLADRYAIVMGSSHAEPMLRNNVTEWTYPHSDYNFSTNREGVLRYWEERLEANGRYENVYTLGMRGIHDSGMTAGSTVQDQVELLEQIIADQRDLLTRHVDPDVDSVPQVFTPYKEVLTLYEAGLRVPDDVTLVWPDDNHGYIRRFPRGGERIREGGSGVYYHISYLGSPLAYLWLYTTPPALVWEEMNKAYALGARDYWIVNVGDIKPAELGMEFFLQMAWNIDQWDIESQNQFLNAWFSREFGSEAGPAAASVMEEYFSLNFERRPEHLQWWLPHTRVRSSDWPAGKVAERVKRFAPGVSVARVSLEAAGWGSLTGGEGAAPTEPPLVVTGVAQPEGVRTLARRQLGLGEASPGDETPLLAFPDHHEFDLEDVMAVARVAAGRPVVVTEKDAVKLAEFPDALSGVAVHVLRLGLHWEAGEAEVRALMGRVAGGQG